MPSFVQGQIIWAAVPDPQQENVKERPLVIVSVPAQVLPGEALVCAAITTQLPSPLPPDYVALPWNANRMRVKTRLTRPCAAVCTWLARIQPHDLHKPEGIVPPTQLKEIIRQVSAILAAEAAKQVTPVEPTSSGPPDGHEPPGGLSTKEQQP